MKVKSIEDCKDSLRETIETLDKLKDRLEKENIYSPLSLLGIPMTFSFFYTVLTGLGSILFAIIN